MVLATELSGDHGKSFNTEARSHGDPAMAAWRARRHFSIARHTEKTGLFSACVPVPSVPSWRSLPR